MDDREALEKSLARRGEVIGNNYVLDEVIGIGGMGVVHVALQRSLERNVAVKIPRPELADDPRVRNMFRNEALTGSRVNHRNIVGVLDFGSERGVPYLVMEHIVGPRLGQLLLDLGPLPLLAAVSIVRQVVAGLEDAHDSGVVHADVKCDNVLLQTARDGSVTPRLIDFGVAHFVDKKLASAFRTDPVVTGTPEYVAPEVARGQRPGPAADVYAIGVMLYELVTGATPFCGETAGAVLLQKLQADPPSLAVTSPDLGISPELDALVSRMLSRDPDARPADARELARCLDATCGGSPTPFPPIVTSIFSEAVTETMTPITDTVETKPPRASIADRRLAVLAAIKDGSVERIAAAYLRLACELVDLHQPTVAEAELEEAVDLVMAAESHGPVWRLLLSLAALYDYRGDHVRARLAARAARDHAAETGSVLGREHSERLCARLG